MTGVYQQVHLAARNATTTTGWIPRPGGAAGMREVGIGALLGLSDWRAEGLALALHLQSLRKQFWRTSFTISFPGCGPLPENSSPWFRSARKT